MRAMLGLVVAAMLLLPIVAFAVPGDVIRSIDSPSSTPTGLTFDGENLWVADRMADTLFALNVRSGRVIKKIPSPGFIPRGLTHDGRYLWCIDAEEERIYKIDPHSGMAVVSIESPTPSPQGIAWDGERLWISDDREDVICQISTEDGTIVERFPAPMKHPTGLTWLNGYLWCGDRKTDKIYLIDPRHGGEVVLAIDAPGKYVRGLAVNKRGLWCVDYQDDKIYNLVLDDGEQYKLTDTKKLNLVITHEFRNYGPGEVPSLDVYLALPSNLPNQNVDQNYTFTVNPIDIILDRWDQPVAHFHKSYPAISERMVYKMDIVAELSDCKQFIFPSKVGSLDLIPADISELYLVDEEKYRITDKRIVEGAQEAIGDETNPYWMMRNIHKYIRERLHYELSGGWNVAPRVLERGNGSCSEYTFLFISMCRSVGIPARYVGAFVVRGDQASTDEVFHRWSQVYLPNYGWVHVDPQGGDKEEPARVAASIGSVSNRFLITTVGGGASEYLGWNYNYQAHWTSKGAVKIHTEAIGEWSPVIEDEE